MANFEPRDLADKARRMDTEMARSGRGMEGLVPPAPVQDMRGGGLVPSGPEGVDTVPAVMEGGTAMLDAPPGDGRQEYVLTPEMVEALGGVEQLDKLRAAVHDAGQVEGRREETGEGMVPEELLGLGPDQPPPQGPGPGLVPEEPGPMGLEKEPMPMPLEEEEAGLVPRMAAGGAMDDDYFTARLANGGVLRNNAGQQIGALSGMGQVLDERGRARAYLGGMAGGGGLSTGPYLTPEDRKKEEQLRASLAPAPVAPAPAGSWTADAGAWLGGRAADFGAWLKESQVAQSYKAAQDKLPSVPKAQPPAIPAQASADPRMTAGFFERRGTGAPDNLQPASAPAPAPAPSIDKRNGVPSYGAAAPAPAAPAGKYSTGVWEHLKPGLYGSPKAPFTVTDEGGVQVIRGPGGPALAPEKAAERAKAYNPTVIQTEDGRRLIMQADDRGGMNVRELADTINPEHAAVIRDAVAEATTIPDKVERKNRLRYISQYAAENGISPALVADIMYQATE